MLPIIKKIWSDEVAELTDRLKRIKSSDRANARYFIFKCGQGLLDTIKSDGRARGEIVDRSQGKAVYILQFNTLSNDHLLHQITKNAVHSIKDQSLIEEIRSCDLREVIDRTNGECFLDAPSSVHFVTPSGKHTTRFLRLSDALYSSNALDRISFWLQPYVARSSAVIIDTWSLSSIILRTQQLLGLDIPFDCFHEHVKRNDSLALMTLNKLARRIEDEKPILFLVGISSSGEFFSALPDLLKRSNIHNEFKSLSIYGFGNTPESVDLLSRLSVEITWFDEGNCDYCNNEDRKTAYQIDSKYYYPRKYEEKPVRFAKHLLKEPDNTTESSASVFIHRHGGNQGVLVVHKDDPNDGVSPRHHAFYINVSKLMSIDLFVEDLSVVVQNIEAQSGVPDVVIAPPHNAAKLIVDHLKKQWGKASFIFCHNLNNLSSEELGSFKSSNHICFVDDVVISGSRIEAYLRSLREELGGEKLEELKTVSWFPLILRTASDADIKRIEDSLSGHGSHWENKLYFVSKIVLPDWSGEGECPWCQEESALDLHVGPLWDDPQWYKQRRSLLKNVSLGIETTPLFVQPFSNHKTLGAGSALGKEGLNEIQVLFLLANGLQILRKKDTSALGRDDLLCRYVLFWENNEQDPKSGTFQRFSEPLIQSCFLRAVKHDEWSRTIWTDGKPFLEQKLGINGSNELIGEALLFYLRRRADGKLQKSTIERILSISDDEAVRLLLSGVSKF